MNVLEAYYSSDDDIAWGPLTLREIKRDLKRTPVKPPRRYSINLGECSSTATETIYPEESQSDNNISTSPIETNLNESQSDDNISTLPIEINLDEFHSDINISTSATDTNVEEFYSDNMSTATETVNVECHRSDNNASSATECYFTPDDDASLKENPNNEQFLQKLSSVINGNAPTEKSFVTALDTSNFTESNDVAMLKCIQKNRSLVSLEDVRQSLVENTIILSEDEESNDCIVISDESYEDEKIVSDHAVKEEKETSLRSDHVSLDVASIDLNSQDDSKSDDSHFEFNDTLAEMEAALKYGLDYQLPEKSPAPKKITVHEDILISGPKSNWQELETPENSLLLPQKTSSMISHSSSIPVRKPANNTGAKFKTPIRPAPKTKFTPNKFKNVVSPISVYIKNTPAACLKENIQTKPNPRLNFRFKENSKENISDNDDDDCEFPAVVYKPAKKVVSKIQRDVILPGSLQKMVTEPTITKHQNRINRQKIDIDRKLVQSNLTIDQSQINEDISFVVQKQTYKK